MVYSYGRIKYYSWCTATVELNIIHGVHLGLNCCWLTLAWWWLRVGYPSYMRGYPSYMRGCPSYMRIPIIYERIPIIYERIPIIYERIPIIYERIHPIYNGMFVAFVNFVFAKTCFLIATHFILLVRQHITRALGKCYAIIIFYIFYSNYSLQIHRSNLFDGRCNIQFIK